MKKEELIILNLSFVYFACVYFEVQRLKVR